MYYICMEYFKKWKYIFLSVPKSADWPKLNKDNEWQLAFVAAVTALGPPTWRSVLFHKRSIRLIIYGTIMKYTWRATCRRNFEKKKTWRFFLWTFFFLECSETCFALILSISEQTKIFFFKNV